MSTTETSTKAPPDTPPSPEVLASVDGPDGQPVPIEITLNQQPTDSTGPVPAQEGVGRLRAWPVALFGTEAATTGASAAYAAAGTAGVLTAAGVAAGGVLIAAGVAAYRARTTSPKGPGGRVLRPSGPRTTSNALSGRGRSGGRGSSTGLGTGGGRGHRTGGRGRSSGLGAVSSGASSPRSDSRPSSTSSASPTRTSPVLNRTNKHTGNSGAGASGFAGRSPSGPAAGSSGKGGLLRRLSQRRNGGAAGSGSLSKDRGPGGGRAGGPGRSTVGAWTRRAARSGMRALAKTMGAGRAARESAANRALSDRIRTGRRSLAKKGKAGVRYVLRSAAAKVAAGAVGALALVPGLLLRTGAAVMGGLLRLLRLAPRTGTKWGIYFTRWSLHLAKTVHTRLMTKAKKRWESDTRPDVMTDFDEPGHTRPLTTADPFGADYFGGNLVSVFQTETEAVREAYAAYDPPMMLAVAAEYWGLPEGVTSVAEAVRQLAVNTADKYPADAKMADQVAAVYALLHQAAQKAAEVGPLFAKVHENDLRRFEEPRPGEHMWNILERRPDGGFDQREPSRFVAVAQDVAHVYARYEPGHMNQVAAEYEGIPAGIENIAAAISLLQVRSNDRYPVDKAVVDAITDVHQVLMQAASAAQELMPSFRRLHAPDIARHEAPRNGEESEAMWDV
ncbi:hypothetical protein YUYDRAFT_03453 [Streptomyces sp. ScaeMP-e48]|uniref:hypothetical protein n=1 Tax=Streptomyces sp. ScaeMP-e48 TaxID=1100823 RepID=UPI0008239DAE|nr:hypothetical protein [Streptomyces sp. ScaeMP-e48]SCK30538.1 hypothetical protein YUYDRAFT_03453 [Streptomyces sp. ScaeMP-e48]